MCAFANTYQSAIATLPDSITLATANIIDPGGEIIAGPAKGEVVLTARGSLEAVYAAKAACEVGGQLAGPFSMLRGCASHA